MRLAVDRVVHGRGLPRFLKAQDAESPSILGGQHLSVFGQAFAELELGRKVTHWMWFVFPQEKGLGRSEMSQRYAIRSPGEARAYLYHPVLGARLKACTSAVIPWLHVKPLEEVFGSVDAVKFRSCMQLFERTGGAKGGWLFRRAAEAEHQRALFAYERRARR